MTYCVSALRDNLNALPDRAAAIAAIADLEQQISDPSLSTLMAGELPAFIDRLQLGLGVVHDALVAAYFARSD